LGHQRGRVPHLRRSSSFLNIPALPGWAHVWADGPPGLDAVLGRRLHSPELNRHPTRRRARCREIGKELIWTSLMRLSHCLGGIEGEASGLHRSGPSWLFRSGFVQTRLRKVLDCMPVRCMPFPMFTMYRQRLDLRVLTMASQADNQVGTARLSYETRNSGSNKSKRALPQVDKSGRRSNRCRNKTNSRYPTAINTPQIPHVCTVKE
jgi:hypothetical protein